LSNGYIEPIYISSSNILSSSIPSWIFVPQNLSFNFSTSISNQIVINGEFYKFILSFLIYIIICKLIFS
jgi:hypothetical protein